VENVRAGDSASLNALARYLRGHFRDLAEASLGKRQAGLQDASDIAQESVVIVCQHLADFRGTTEPEFQKWVRTILKHEVLDKVRYDRQPKRDVRRKQALPENADGSVLLASDTSTPSREVIRREEEERRAEALARLSEDDQRVIRLRYDERRSWFDISELMQRSDVAVKQSYYRALRRLRKELGADR
jgi:RNA polymerase sigma-70 factor (subfamily 1)